MDGVEVCKEIRKREDHPYIYLLLLTAKQKKEDVIIGMEGGDAFGIDRCHRRYCRCIGDDRQGCRVIDDVGGGSEVGDDVYGEDPTVNRLEIMAAERMGKEAAIFTTSGTQSNITAVLAQTSHGNEIILGNEAHMLWYEVGGAASLAGVVLRTLVNDPALQNHKISTLRYVKAGAMPIPPEIKRKWEEMTGVPMVLGYGLSRYRFPGKRLFSWLMYIPVVIPDIVMAVAMLSFFALLNRLLGLFELGMLTM
jgi:CheY-like chemotaxis protein